MACPIWRIENLIIEDGKVECQTQSDRMRGGHFRLGYGSIHIFHKHIFLKFLDFFEKIWPFFVCTSLDLLDLFYLMDLFGTFWDLLWPFRTFYDFFGISWNPLIVLGPFGTFWDLCRYFWTFLGIIDTPSWKWLRNIWMVPMSNASWYAFWEFSTAAVFCDLQWQIKEMKWKKREKNIVNISIGMCTYENCITWLGKHTIKVQIFWEGQKFWGAFSKNLYFTR